MLYAAQARRAANTALGWDVAIQNTWDVSPVDSLAVT